MISKVVHRLIANYHDWLRAGTSVRDAGEWVEITTPFLDRHNDCLQVFLQPCENGFLLTDHGYTIDDLEFCGVSLDTDTRKSLLSVTLNGFAVRLNGAELQVTATFENVGVRMHNLLQAMLAVNDLYVLSRSSVANVFGDDVAEWLKNANVSFERNYMVVGSSGLDYRFDFRLPPSEMQPPRYLVTINSSFRAAVERTICAWVDTRSKREDDSRGYVVYNDRSGKLSPKLRDALLTSGVQSAGFNEIESWRNQLAA